MLCGFVALWLCGFVALWLCGFGLAQPLVFTITKDFFESQSKPENNSF
jgi:hypothetical protein